MAISEKDLQKVIDIMSNWAKTHNKTYSLALTMNDFPKAKMINPEDKNLVIGYPPNNYLH